MIGPPTALPVADGRPGLPTAGGAPAGGLVRRHGGDPRVHRRGPGGARGGGQAHLRVDRGADGDHQRWWDPPDRPGTPTATRWAPPRSGWWSRGPGDPCPPGCGARSWCRGPELFVGYGEAAQTRDAVRRGWFATGDLGALDDEGWLTIGGRMKELIIRGGENIASAEVERVLEQHPGVRQAVVVGRPDRPVRGAGGGVRGGRPDGGRRRVPTVVRRAGGGPLQDAGVRGPHRRGAGPGGGEARPPVAEAAGRRAARPVGDPARSAAVAGRRGDVEGRVPVEEPDGHQAEAAVLHRHDRPVLGPGDVGDAERVPDHDVGVDDGAVGRRPARAGRRPRRAGWGSPPRPGARRGRTA